MDCLFLQGQHEISLDCEGRFALPEGIRKRLHPAAFSEGFYVLIGHNQKPWLYPDKVYETLASGLSAEAEVSGRDFVRDVLPTVEFAKVDAQDRLRIPPRLMELVGMDGLRDFYLLGCRHRLDFWTKPDWEKERMLWSVTAIETEMKFRSLKR